MIGQVVWFAEVHRRAGKFVALADLRTLLVLPIQHPAPDVAAFPHPGRYRRAPPGWLRVAAAAGELGELRLRDRCWPMA